MCKFTYVLFLSLISFTLAINNGLGQTPQMGWNTWNKFDCDINEDLIKQTADVLVTSGLAQAGYRYLNLDDCWQKDRDPLTKRIRADPQKFPSGMASLVDYVHSKGLKFGLYSDAGYRTCGGKPGSLGFEEVDAQQYSEWDIDYLKYDNCYNDGTSPKLRYWPMVKALGKQKKKIFLSMCEWGQENPSEWAGFYANSWRTTMDIEDTWASFTKILDAQVGLEKFAGPGGWNDPDMLEVGNGGMTTTEYISHFALWALLKAPLIIGCDITKMSQDTQSILLNHEIIAINQDSLGLQGSRIWKQGDQEVWTCLVQDNGRGLVVILFNRSYKIQNIRISIEQLGLNSNRSYAVRDLQNHRNLNEVYQFVSGDVPAHGVVVLKLFE